MFSKYFRKPLWEAFKLVEKKRTHAPVKFLLIENYYQELGRANVRFKMEENFDSHMRAPLESMKKLEKTC